MTEKPDERPEEIEEAVDELKLTEETEVSVTEPIATDKKVPEKGQKGKPKGKEKRKIRPSQVAVAVLATALIGTMVFFMWPAAEEEDWEIVDGSVPLGGRGTVAVTDNFDEIRDRLSGPNDDSYYITMMNVDWVFDRWDVQSKNAYVANSKDNRRTVYFDIHLQETGELVYSSPFIPVGSELYNFALDSEVSVGVHPAIVTYHLVDDNHENITTVSVTVTLIILE